MVEFTPFIAPLAALVLFWYGIEHLSKEFQQVASEKFGALTRRLTTNRFSGAMLGAATAAALQSSTATVLILVGLVDASVISFHQALGVMVGANVGTTLTAQLVAFRVAEIAPILLIAGFAISAFGRKIKSLGKPLFYVGLVLFALSYLSDGLAGFKDDPRLIAYFTSLHNPLLAVLVGMIASTLLQSSAVTTGMIVILGQQGIIGLGRAVPLVIGANLGTSFITTLASNRSGVFARRTAIAHLTFNIAGVLIFIPFLAPFTQLMMRFADVGQGIAMTHTVFNVVNASICLVFLYWLERFVEYVVPTKEQELLFKAKFVTPIPRGRKRAIIAVRHELLHQMDLIEELFETAHKMIVNGSNNKLERVKKLEAISDFLDDEISHVLLTLSQSRATKQQAREIYTLTHVSNEIEQIADFGEDYGDMAQKLAERALKLYPVSIDELNGGYALLRQNIIATKGLILNPDRRTYLAMKHRTKKLNHLINKSYARQIRYIAKVESASFAGTVFVDAVAALERANGRLIDCAKLLTGRED